MSSLSGRRGVMIDRNELQKLIRMTGERARIDAKANNTYIVYETNDGTIVKEYPNGGGPVRKELSRLHQVQKWGNSLGIRIPETIASRVGFEEGFEVDILVDGDSIVISRKSKLSLDEMLSQITPDNQHKEI